MSHYKSTTSIEVGILGENVNDWKDGLAHAAKWCRDTSHIMKAHPSLADVALIVTQYTAPGALKTLNTLLRGIGKGEVAEEYPETLILTATTNAAIAARRQFHDQWLAEILAACSEDEQLPLIWQIDEHVFPAAPQGEPYSLREIAPYTAWLQNLFATLDPEVRDRLKGNAEIRDAVYRKIPLEIRHLIKNIRDHDDEDFEDTWETICERLTEQAHLSQKALPAVRAFSAHLAKKARREDAVQTQKQRNNHSVGNNEVAVIRELTATLTPKEARSLLQNTSEPPSGTENELERRITCKDCNKQFDFSKGEAAFYSRKNLTVPMRCQKCRDQRKAENESGKRKLPDTKNNKNNKTDA